MAHAPPPPPPSPPPSRQALQKLDIELDCPICLQPYVSPKVLSCLHTFCSKCLKRVKPAASPANPSPTLSCPTCRQATPLPAGGVEDLQPAFYIHFLYEIQALLRRGEGEEEGVCCLDCRALVVAGYQCCDCEGLFCTSCGDTHKQTSAHSLETVAPGRTTRRAKQSSTPLSRTEPYHCPVHSGMTLELFCEDCSKLICSGCLVEEHRGHDYDLVGGACLRHRPSVVSSCRQLEAWHEMLGGAVGRVESSLDEIQKQRESIEESIEKDFEKLHRELEERKNVLLKRVQKTTESKSEALSLQRSHLQQAKGQLASCVQFIHKYTEASGQSDHEFLALKRPIEKQVEELGEKFTSITHAPVKRADLGYVMDESYFHHTCGRLGAVYTRRAEPRNCTARGSNTGLVGERLDYHVKVRDQHGVAMVMENKDTPLKGRLESCLDDDSTVECTLEEEGEERRLTCTPVARGRYLLVITVGDSPIGGSPFPVTIKTGVKSLGSPIKIVTGLSEPWGIAVNSKGEVLVAESEGKRISLLDVRQGQARALIRESVFHSNLQRPVGVAVDREDSVFVTDVACFNLQKFSKSGEFIREIGNYGYLPLEFTYPSGIGVHPASGQLYITEWKKNNRVQILGSGGTEFEGWFGVPGKESGELCSPSGVAFDRKGDVFVIDSDNHRIQVFTEKGEHLRSFGRWGRGEGRLRHPSSVAIDNEDIVYVTERTGHRVSLFTSGGEFLHCFGSQGSGPGQFNHPHGVAIDGNGFVYVSDKDNNRVQIF